jgi:hypothetical protein
MNDSTIQMIAQAIIANTKVIQSLIDALPHETKQAVAEVVAPAPVIKPVVESAPVVKPVVESAPVVTAPVVAPAMPAPPTFAPAAPAPAPAPVAAPSAAAPFTDGKGLIDYVMAAYRTMGPQKGAQIQNVLTGLGYQNINDIKPADYAALYAGVEALKAS